MSKIQILGLRSCDTCKKALAAFKGCGKNATLLDIRDEPLSGTEFSFLYDELGEGLLNTRSTTWRGLSDEQKARPATDLLVEYPALMKRPVIRLGSMLTLGWTPEVQAKWLD